MCLLKTFLKQNLVGNLKKLSLFIFVFCFTYMCYVSYAKSDHRKDQGIFMSDTSRQERF